MKKTVSENTNNQAELRSRRFICKESSIFINIYQLAHRNT